MDKFQKMFPTTRVRREEVIHARLLESEQWEEIFLSQFLYMCIEVQVQIIHLVSPIV